LTRAAKRSPIQLSSVKGALLLFVFVWFFLNGQILQYAIKRHVLSISLSKKSKREEKDKIEQSIKSEILKLKAKG
jgi:hypothetical protein